MSGSTRLRRHRMLLQKYIGDYLAASPEEQVVILIRIRSMQARFGQFRKTPQDWADPLAWVDSWRPPA